jgi:two-component system, response regulator, stage 0 sporulation protein F
MANGVEPHRLAHKSILIADDDVETRRMMGTHFRRAGYDVTEVGDGCELVRSVNRLRSRSHPRAVVVTDVEMPNMNGLDALVKIRRSMPETPVIVVTGDGDDTVHARARRLGAAAVFSKPVDLELLRTTAALLVDV